MPNRTLNANELEKANALLSTVREQLDALSHGDSELLFAYRRKISKELIYDERSKPGERRKLKAQKRREQKGLCPDCGRPLPATYCVLDRTKASAGYTPANTKLICQDCDTRTQKSRRYA